MTVSFRSTIFATLGALMFILPATGEAQPRPCAPHERHCQAPGKNAPHHGPQARPQQAGPSHGQAARPQIQPPQAHRPPAPHRPPAAHHQGHRPAPPAFHNGPGKPHPHFAVRPGQSAAKARPFQRGKNSRFHAPPRGQEYRVLNDHLVLADSRTLKVIAVMGLMNELLR